MINITSRSILSVSQSNDMGSGCRFTFGNVPSNPVINLGFPALPAFATGHEPYILNFYGIYAHANSCPVTKCTFDQGKVSRPSMMFRVMGPLHIMEGLP